MQLLAWCCQNRHVGWKPGSAQELILCVLWPGCKRRTSEEQKWNPFAYLSYGPVRASVREGPSTVRAGTGKIGMTPFLRAPFQDRLDGRREKGKREREPLVSVYKRCHKFAETINEDLKNNRCVFHVLHIWSSTRSWMGAAFIFVWMHLSMCMYNGTYI